MGDLLGDFMGFLPKLIGALLVFGIGMAIAVGPLLLYRLLQRKADGRWFVLRLIVAVVAWTWAVLVAIVVAGMAIDVLGFDALSGAADTALAAVPRIFVVVFPLAVIVAVVRAVAARSDRAPT